jgi:UDP-GlcNAc3NAcA epimerase
MPQHPRTRALIEGAKIPVSFKAIGPLGYLDMLTLVQLSEAIITDSGGLSREAYFFKKPSLVIMKHPFWPELQEFGRSLRADSDRDVITEKFQALISMDKSFREGIFGAGHAADAISNLILQNA